MTYALEHDGERFELFYYQTQETVSLYDKAEHMLWIYTDSEAQRFWKQYILSLKYFHVNHGWTIDKVLENILEGIDHEHDAS